MKEFWLLHRKWSECAGTLQSSPDGRRIGCRCRPEDQALPKQRVLHQGHESKKSSLRRRRTEIACVFLPVPPRYRLMHISGHALGNRCVHENTGAERAKAASSRSRSADRAALSMVRTWSSAGIWHLIRPRRGGQPLGCTGRFRRARLLTAGPAVPVALQSPANRPAGRSLADALFAGTNTRIRTGECYETSTMVCFSKVLFPSLRRGYLVVPEALIDRFAAAKLNVKFSPVPTRSSPQP